MRFIDVTRLNKLYEGFQLHKPDNEDFQGYVEKINEDGKHVYIDTEPVRKLLEKMHDEDYNYLIACEDEDFRFFGADYLERINLFRILLGEKQPLTMEDIKRDRKNCRTGFELVELKTDASCYEYIIKNITTNRILNWGGIPEVGILNQYIVEHPWPKDLLYSEQQFLNDVGSLSGCLHLKVENIDTAEFICAMIYELSE